MKFVLSAIKKDNYVNNQPIKTCGKCGIINTRDECPCFNSYASIKVDMTVSSPQQKNTWEDKLEEKWSDIIEDPLMEYAFSEGFVNAKEYPYRILKEFKSFISQALTEERETLRKKIKEACENFPNFSKMTDYQKGVWNTLQDIEDLLQE